MAGPERLFPDIQCTLVEALRFRMAALIVINRRQITDGRGQGGVVRPHDLFADRKRALEERLRLGVAGLVPIDVAEIIEQPDQVGVARPQRPLAYCQRARIEFLGFTVIAALLVDDRTQAGESLGEVRIMSPESLFADRDNS